MLIEEATENSELLDPLTDQYQLGGEMITTAHRDSQSH